jgi:hypothetical protein
LRAFAFALGAASVCSTTGFNGDDAGGVTAAFATATVGAADEPGRHAVAAKTTNESTKTPTIVRVSSELRPRRGASDSGTIGSSDCAAIRSLNSSM